MKKIVHLFILTFIILLSSCSSKAVKYSPGDSWNIQLTSDYSLNCDFKEINCSQLIFTLSKENKTDFYNFAIKGDIPCDNLFVNDIQVSAKTSGVVPITYFDVSNFDEINTIRIPFREGTDEYKKINIVTYDSFLKEGDKSYIGIVILLYKY